MQLRDLGDEMLAACLLPYPAAKSAAQAVQSRWMKRADFLSAQNIGSKLGKMLLPAYSNWIDAELRVQSTHHRLLTIEAVRHYAATHDGKLPQSLAELTELPPQIDLHTGELVGYELKSGPEGEWADFSIQIPIKEYKILRMKFRQ
jgi:hypothetical protein